MGRILKSDIFPFPGEVECIKGINLFIVYLVFLCTRHGPRHWPSAIKQATALMGLYSSDTVKEFYYA